MASTTKKPTPAASNGKLGASAQAASADELRRRAIEAFESGTGLRWTRVLEETFASWVGGPVDYGAWNADIRRARRLRRALLDVLTYAAPGDTAFRLWISDDEAEFSVGGRRAIDRLLRGLERFAPTDPAGAKAISLRQWSADVRVIRFIDRRDFLGLRRRATLDELTAVSILLGTRAVSSVNTAPTIAAYWRMHKQRIYKARSDHPKMTDQEAAAARSQLAVPPEPVRWPPIERIRPT